MVAGGDPTDMFNIPFQGNGSRRPSHRRGRGIAIPFLVGTAVGGVAGAVVGTLLSRHMSHALAAMIGLVDRRLAAGDSDELRFELLLQ